jgi:hypothetical protein
MLASRAAKASSTQRASAAANLFFAAKFRCAHNAASSAAPSLSIWRSNSSFKLADNAVERGSRCETEPDLLLSRTGRRLERIS